MFFIYRKVMSMPAASDGGDDSPYMAITDKIDWRITAYNGVHLWKDTDDSNCQVMGENNECKVR